MPIFNNITKIFNKKSDTKILGIDIGSSSIKVVQLSRKKGIAVLDTFGEISLAIYTGKKIGSPVILSAEKTAEALTDLMKEAQVTATAVAFAIPLKSTLMFNLKIPKTIIESQLNDIVKVEARKYIPVPITEVQMDWSILPARSQKEKESKNYHILIVAIHKETLKKYYKIASIIGLSIKFLEVETFSTIRSIVKHHSNTVVIIDIGASITKFYIVESGIVRKSTVINIGSAKMFNFFGIDANNESAFNSIGNTAKLMRENDSHNNLDISTKIPTDLVRIINEVKKNIIEYQKTNNEDITEIVLTGGGILAGVIVDYFKSEFSVNVVVGDPFSKVENPAFLDKALHDAGATFSVAVGIALRGLK